MALPLTIETLEGIDESIQKLYVEKNGKYSLDVTGMPELPSDYEEIKASRDLLDANNQKLLKQKAAAKKETEEALLKAAKENNDVESVSRSYDEKIVTLETSWGDKYKTLEAEMGSKDTENTRIINDLTVNATAQQIAAKLANNPIFIDVFMPHLVSRLQVEIKDGKTKMNVLDKLGKLSAQTVDELYSEFKVNPAFAELVEGTKSSGNGASDGSGDSGSNIIKRSDYNKLTSQEQRDFIIVKKGKIVDD